MKGTAIERLATYICELGPSPADRPPVTVQAGDTTQELPTDATGQPLARVFKTLADPYVGKISMLRVLSGTIRPDTVLTNPRSHTDERLHALFTLRGKEQDSVAEAPAGDLVAVAKLSDTTTGDTLAPKGTPVVAPGPAPAPPVLSVAIRPRSKGDEDKLMSSLHRLQEEDPSIEVVRSDETHQTVLAGMGETHLSIACERLHRKFGVDVETEEVRVPYRETITKPAEAEGKYKKQTGGHGQFGVANLKVAPRERGEAEAMQQGGVHGYPVVDVQVTVYDGKYHSVDSSEMSFKMAGTLGFKAAVAEAGPVLLEPISALEVSVPADFSGDVISDLNSRRGRIQGTDSGNDGEQIVIALVPTSEVQRYAIDLRSLTGGRGRFTVSHHHYDVVPSHLVARLTRSQDQA